MLPTRLHPIWLRPRFRRDWDPTDPQYDGTGQDGIVLFDAYKALVLAAGWTEADQATPLIGSFAMGDRTLVITAFGGDTSQIIVSAITNRGSASRCSGCRTARSARHASEQTRGLVSTFHA